MQQSANQRPRRPRQSILPDHARRPVLDIARDGV